MSLQFTPPPPPKKTQTKTKTKLSHKINVYNDNDVSNHCWIWPDKLKHRTIIKDKNKYLFFLNLTSLVQHQIDDFDFVASTGAVPVGSAVVSQFWHQYLRHFIDVVISASISSKIVLFVCKHRRWTSLVKIQNLSPRPRTSARMLRLNLMFLIGQTFNCIN